MLLMVLILIISFLFLIFWLFSTSLALPRQTIGWVFLSNNCIYTCISDLLIQKESHKRRERDSNSHFFRNSFQDYCLTIRTTSPLSTLNFRLLYLLTSLALILIIPSKFVFLNMSKLISLNINPSKYVLK